MVDKSSKILNVPYDDILYRLEFYGWYFANVTYGKDYLMQLSSTGVFWARYQKQKTSPPNYNFQMYGTNPEQEWLRFLNDNNIDASKLPESVCVNFMAPLWIIHAKESTWKDELRQLFLGLGYAILTLAVPVILGKLLGWAMAKVIDWYIMRLWLEEISAVINKIDALRDISVTSRIEMAAEEVNAWWIARGCYNPYLENTPVYDIILAKNTNFVRVYPEGGSAAGSWIMKAEDIQGLTAQQIQEKFALPALPKYVCDAEIEAGSTIRCGIAGPQPAFGGQGGGVQFDLMQQYIGSFTNTRLLP